MKPDNGDEQMQTFSDLLNSTGDLAAEIETATAGRNVERLNGLHAAMARFLAGELDPDQRQQWESFWADLILSSSDPLLDNLAALIGAAPEAERFLSAKWLAERLWHKRIYHPNPATGRYIRGLIATSGRSTILEVWQPKAVIIAVGEADILKLNLHAAEERISTEANRQFEDLVWEECRGIRRRDARRQSPEEEMPDDRPSILDALIAQETPGTIRSLLESPKYTRKMKAFLRTELDLLREHPDVPERDLLTLICDRLKITPANAWQIKSRIKRK
jgi:hypothetical protein